ncbi:hypothetical protein HBI55_013200 [Parastagonospora nodorum]|nr:hypothetical protein HBI09_014330 [Parastagonospora nodorum]KAH4177709.1 hypothetical protein HBH43_035280 [Parastagonospora nodorum]KAH4710734.1 hypothetical protein HBH67_029670 [Parastagonospora nodorum]KAH5316215.1 hypothetical protein HBI11_067300 [Parastagonospora nodorum]KAH5332701.1 hypothetical protein HBI50_046240 [Parastagonospora nodorum]
MIGEDPPAKISASSNPACRSVRVSSKLRGPYHTQIDVALSELVKYARNVESARILGHTDNFTLTIGTVTVSFRIADWKADQCNYWRPHPSEYCQVVDILALLKTCARFPSSLL